MPKEKTRRTICVGGVFDIETENWDKFVVGGVLLRTLEDSWSTEIYWHDREEDFVDRLLSIKGTLWAHNGGRYDALWLADKIIRRGIRCEINLAGQRIVRLKCGDLEIRDSFALVPIALKLASEMGGNRKQDTQLPCVCEKACGGYCSIRRDMPASFRERIISYLRGDLSSLRDTLVSLKEFAACNDIDLCGTIGASAYKTVARRLGIKPAKWKENEYVFIREAYYGGRTQVFNPCSESGYRIDTNSAYIAALSKLALPVGKPRKNETHNQSKKDFDKGKTGVFQCTVHVPYQHIPPLPFRTDKRIAYPWGNITGSWTSLELRYAVSNHGVKILRFGRSIIWDETDYVFTDFEAELWKIRADAGTKTAFGQWIKWLANSQTGKFAQHPLVDIVEINTQKPSKERFCPADWKCKGRHYEGHPCCEHHCSRRCGVWESIDRDGFIWTTKKWRIADCVHIHWAAFLTAYQRVYLHRQLIDDGINGLSAVYCDTDSVYSERERTKDIGQNLGQWKFEGRYKAFRAIAPKTYTYLDYETGEVEAKAKGIPDAVANWINMQDPNKGAVIDRGVKSFKSAIQDKRDGIFLRQSIVRKVLTKGQWYGDRRLNPETGLTEPVTVGELKDIP